MITKIKQKGAVATKTIPVLLGPEQNWAALGWIYYYCFEFLGLDLLHVRRLTIIKGWTFKGELHTKTIFKRLKVEPKLNIFSISLF